MSRATTSETISHRLAEDRETARLGFIDSARGLCVLLMVAAGAASLPFSPIEQAWLGRVAAFSSTFAAAAFFLLAGMVLRHALAAPLSAFIQHKIAPLVWRYVLWAAAGALIALWIRAPLKAASVFQAFGGVLVDPPAMLLIICALPLCFMAMRLLRGRPVMLVLPIAAALEISHLGFGGPIPASFFRLFVYLYIGHMFAVEIRMLARFVAAHRMQAMCGLAVWAVFNGLAVFVTLPFTQATVLAHLPFASFGLGLLGAVATIALASLIETGSDAISARRIGENALGVYLASSLLIETLRGAGTRFASGFAPGASLLIVAAVVLIAALAGLLTRRRESAPEGVKSGGDSLASMASRASPR